MERLRGCWRNREAGGGSMEAGQADGLSLAVPPGAAASATQPYTHKLSSNTYILNFGECSLYGLILLKLIKEILYLSGDTGCFIR
uniref:Uncharacterized protein n=1 Tax=Heterorhabditis bacteriophora TaxID=37862 RepID=A0A1I7XPW2_HETBA